MFTSRADRVPQSYRRQYRISEHALERFRERVDDEYVGRTDHDLMNLFDEKLRAAERKWQVLDARAPDKVTWLCALSTHRAGRFYAVVRDMTAVTVLDERMALNNFAGWWPEDQAPPPTSPHHPFASLASLKVSPAIPDKPDLLLVVPPRSTPPAPVTVESPLDVARCAVAAAALRRREARAELDRAEAELDAATDRLATLTEGR